MKTETQKISNVLLTGCMLICIAAGWILGSITTDTFAQSQSQKRNNNYSNKTISLPSTSINGESMPTIFFSEIIITSY